MKPLTFSAMKYTSKETTTAKQHNPNELIETQPPISTMNKSTRMLGGGKSCILSVWGGGEMNKVEQTEWKIQ
jgi:hypothetical protein